MLSTASGSSPPLCSRTYAMPPRHAFAHVFATALIAIAAALLHPLLDAPPQGGLGIQGAGADASGARSAAAPYSR